LRSLSTDLQLIRKSEHSPIKHIKANKGAQVHFSFVVSYSFSLSHRICPELHQHGGLSTLLFCCFPIFHSSGLSPLRAARTREHGYTSISLFLICFLCRTEFLKGALIEVWFELAVMLSNIYFLFTCCSHVFLLWVKVACAPRGSYRNTCYQVFLLRSAHVSRNVPRQSFLTTQEAGPAHGVATLATSQHFRFLALAHQGPAWNTPARLHIIM
jgi:hypothetical protein